MVPASLTWIWVNCSHMIRLLVRIISTAFSDYPEDLRSIAMSEIVYSNGRNKKNFYSKLNFLKLNFIVLSHQFQRQFLLFPFRLSISNIVIFVLRLNKRSLSTMNVIDFNQANSLMHDSISKKV